MSEFYTELKELRESQNIDLEEIHSRTKINMEYLTAIENGQFDVLPLPYVRLFMRAYVTEIGGEADEALHQLDIFQGRKVGKRISRKEYQRAYRAANKEKLKEAKKAYYEANKEKIKEANKAYYEANKEKMKEYQRAYREANKEKIKEFER